MPILDAIIAKKPGAIMIAPVDKTQLIKPLKKAFDEHEVEEFRRFLDKVKPQDFRQ